MEPAWLTGHSSIASIVIIAFSNPNALLRRKSFVILDRLTGSGGPSISKWLIAALGIFSLSSAADAALPVTKGGDTTAGVSPFDVERPVLPAMSLQRPLDGKNAELGIGNHRLLIPQFDDVDDDGGDEDPGGGGGGGGGDGDGDGGGGGGGGGQEGGGGGTDPVPEPASWAMLIIGFGLTDAAMRQRVRARKSL